MCVRACVCVCGAGKLLLRNPDEELTVDPQERLVLPHYWLRLVDREGAFVASRPFGVWGALEAFGWRCIVVGVLKVHCGGCF